MKKVIITGANGFVGCALVKELVKNDVEVLAMDMPGCNGNLPVCDKVKFLPLALDNISGLKDLIDDRDFDCFYHFAWAGSAGATMAAAFASGNKPGLGYIYGSGKLVAHTMAMSVAADIGIDLVWAEITNAYGVGELSPRMVNTTIRKVIKGEEPQFTAGTQNYDFVYIDDVAKAFYLIGKNGKPFNEYLIGSSNAKPLKEFLLEMKAAIAPDLNFIFGDIPFTGINLPLEKYDCSKTEKDTSFKAQISFGEGCRRTMEWLKQVEVNK